MHCAPSRFSGWALSMSFVVRLLVFRRSQDFPPCRSPSVEHSCNFAQILSFFWEGVALLQMAEGDLWKFETDLVDCSINCLMVSWFRPTCAPLWVVIDRDVLCVVLSWSLLRCSYSLQALEFASRPLKSRLRNFGVFCEIIVDFSVSNCRFLSCLVVRLLW